MKPPPSTGKDFYVDNVEISATVANRRPGPSMTRTSTLVDTPFTVDVLGQ